MYNWCLSKWYIIKQTGQQLIHTLCNQGLTQKGHDAYDYCCKVIIDQYEPISYAEIMFENDIKEIMNELSLPRKDAALICAGRLAKYIAPWDFWKKKYKIVTNN